MTSEFRGDGGGGGDDAGIVEDFAFNKKAHFGFVRIGGAGSDAREFFGNVTKLEVVQFADAQCLVSG